VWFEDYINYRKQNGQYFLTYRYRENIEEYLDNLSRISQLFQGEKQKLNFYHIKLVRIEKILSCRRRNRKGATMSNC